MKFTKRESENYKWGERDIGNFVSRLDMKTSIPTLFRLIAQNILCVHLVSVYIKKNDLT